MLGPPPVTSVIMVPPVKYPCLFSSLLPVAKSVAPLQHLLDVGRVPDSERLGVVLYLLADVARDIKAEIDRSPVLPSDHTRKISGLSRTPWETFLCLRLGVRVAAEQKVRFRRPYRPRKRPVRRGSTTTKVRC